MSPARIRSYPQDDGARNNDGSARGQRGGRAIVRLISDTSMRGSAGWKAASVPAENRGRNCYQRPRSTSRYNGERRRALSLINSRMQY